MTDLEPAAADNRLKIVIVGAGICGLACARALRAPGREITVIERSHFLHESGAAVTISPNASRSLVEWGVTRGKATDRSATVWSHAQSEEVLAEVKDDSYDNVNAPWGYFHRQDLHAELRNLATDPSLPGEPAKIILGSEVVNIDAEAGVVETKNKGRFHGDIVIGSDGVRSVSRNFVLHKETPAEASGMTIFRALIPQNAIEEDPLLKKHYIDASVQRLCICPGLIVVIYWCRGSEILNLALGVADNLVKDVLRSDSDAIRTRLLSIGESEKLSEPIRRLLGAVKQVGLWQVLQSEPYPTWVDGRVILLGDAAHPMAPTQAQGACSAIEDAEAIARYVGGFQSGSPPKGKTTMEEINALLRKVFDVRHARVSSIQKVSSKLVPWHLDRNRTEASPFKSGLIEREFYMAMVGYKGCVQYAEENGIEPPAASRRPQQA